MEHDNVRISDGRLIHVVVDDTPNALAPTTVLDDIAGKRFRLLRLMFTVRSVVCLSLCHVRALCSNGRRCRHDFSFLAHDSPDRVNFLFQNGTSLPPKCGSQMHIPGPTLRRVLPPVEYDRRHRQDFFCIRAMSPLPNYFGPRLSYK